MRRVRKKVGREIELQNDDDSMSEGARAQQEQTLTESLIESTFEDTFPDNIDDEDPLEQAVDDVPDEEVHTIVLFPTAESFRVKGTSNEAIVYKWH